MGFKRLMNDRALPHIGAENTVVQEVINTYGFLDFFDFRFCNLT